MTEPWMLDEIAHAGREHLDTRSVDGYDRKQGSAPDEAAAEDIEILRDQGLDGDSTVIDMGAGTGRFAVAAARHFGRVVAVDVSPAMLQRLEARVAQEGLVNVECVRGGLLSYDHTGDRVDAVHCRNALHQVPDLWKAVALHRIAGLLRPGGVLRLRDLIYDFTPDEAEAVFADWLDSAASDPAEGYTDSDLAEHIREEHSTFSWLLAPMLEMTGFRIVDASNRPTYGAYTCVKH